MRSVTDVNGKTITATFANGRLTRLAHASGAFVSIEYNAAGRVQAVATWASQQLQPLANSGKPLTLVGHSLGAYVCAQTALALGSTTNLRLVALDPAAAALKADRGAGSTGSCCQGPLWSWAVRFLPSLSDTF